MSKVTKQMPDQEKRRREDVVPAIFVEATKQLTAHKQFLTRLKIPVGPVA